MTRTAFVIASFLYVSLSSPASAQSSKPFSLQASFLSVGVTGAAYEGSQAGLGVEGQVRYNFPSALSIGVGLQISQHDFVEASGISDPLTQMGLFIEPRYVIRPSDLLIPYLAGRLAFLSQSTKVSGSTVSATGMQFSGGGGVLYGLTGNLLIDVGASYGVVTFGSYSGGGGGEAGSGSNVVFRIGLSAGIGK